MSATRATSRCDWTVQLPFGSPRSPHPRAPPPPDPMPPVRLSLLASFLLPTFPNATLLLLVAVALALGRRHSFLSSSSRPLAFGYSQTTNWQYFTATSGTS
ncbi:hypothetical protein ABZP36_002267 [Zizania latifolia]